jgi:hypothetical protein
MSPADIKQLVETLRQAGVTHYKTPEIELDLGPLPPAAPESTEKTEIPHVVEDLISVMKLNDKDLVDRLFPDTETKEEVDEL